MFYYFSLLCLISYHRWQYMRHGVGSCLLQKILTSSHMRHGDHAFCWPTPISSAAGGDKAEWTKQQAGITAFYRKVRSFPFFPSSHNYLLTSLRPLERLPTHRTHLIPCLLPRAIPSLAPTPHRIGP